MGGLLLNGFTVRGDRLGSFTCCVLYRTPHIVSLGRVRRQCSAFFHNLGGFLVLTLSQANRYLGQIAAGRLRIQGPRFSNGSQGGRNIAQVGMGSTLDQQQWLPNTGRKSGRVHVWRRQHQLLLALACVGLGQCYNQFSPFGTCSQGADERRFS